MIDLNTNIVEDGKNLLITQYKDAEKLKKLLQVFLEEVQQFEDITHSLYLSRTIDSAIGIQLDHVGSIPGQLRNGLSDEDYRVRIKAKIAENNSEGTRSEILAMAALLFPGSSFLILEKKAEYIITIINTVPYTGDWDEIRASFLNATVSGVNIVLQESIELPFGFQGNEGTNHPRGGFGVGHLATIR